MGVTIPLIEVNEGEPFILVSYWLAPDRVTPLCSPAGTAQGRVTSTDLHVYKVAGPDARDLVFTVALAATCFPNVAPTVGDGLTSYAKGWNFRDVWPGNDARGVLEGGETYDLIYTAHGSGSLAGVAFDPMVMTVRCYVRPRKNS